MATASYTTPWDMIWQTVTKAGFIHFPMTMGSGKKAAQWPAFNWANTTLGNVKAALAGTYHNVSQKHAQRYLASFAWRLVAVPDETLEGAARLCMALGTDGLRGELTLVRAARALAALDGAHEVGEAQLKRVAPTALRHRLRRNPLDEAGSTVRVERAIAELFGP